MHNRSVPLIPARSVSPSLRRIVTGFTPNWFATTMGTGILSLALAQFPSTPALRATGETLFYGNILLFAALAVLLAARFLIDFRGAAGLLHQPVMSMFFGCIPMGLATIVNGLLIYGVPQWGEGAANLAQFLWWMDAALAFACGLAVPLSMFTRQAHALDRMTAIWLLPLVASEVAAVSGGLLLPHVDAADQMTVLTVSLVLWACSVPIALSVLVLLFLRLATHKVPEAGMAASIWLPIGPIGTGALGLAVFAEVCPPVLAAHALGSIAGAFSGTALFGAILLWGYGLWWLAIAALATLRYFSGTVPFNLGWWGYTFPLGVYALATLRLSHAFGLPLLTGFGTALVALLGMLWLLIALRTLHLLFGGSRAHAPVPAAMDYSI